MVGKTASVTAMALTVASYVAPDDRWLQRIVAVGAVVALAALNYRGITKTAALARVLLVLTLVALASLVISIQVFGETEVGHLDGIFTPGDSGIYGVLQSAGLLFFAFAGYARIATLGEEVRDPETSIPTAIPLALFITVAIYTLVGVSILLAAGPERLADATAPLMMAVNDAGVGDVAPAIRAGGIVASLGALLALIAGIARTTLAMTRNGDLPSWLAAVHPIHKVPHHAEIALAVIVSVLVLLVDLRNAIGFSSFGVLMYYAIANASAWTQAGEFRRWPKALNALGLIGCLVLVATLPVASVVTGIGVFAIGLIGRAVVLRQREER